MALLARCTRHPRFPTARDAVRPIIYHSRQSLKDVEQVVIQSCAPGRGGRAEAVRVSHRVPVGGPHLAVDFRIHADGHRVVRRVAGAVYQIGAV